VDELNSQDVIDLCIVAGRNTTTTRRTRVLSDPSASTGTTPSILYYLPKDFVLYDTLGETNLFSTWEMTYDVLQITNSIYNATDPNTEDALTLVLTQTQQAWNATLQAGWVDDQLLELESLEDPFYRTSIVGLEAELFSRGTVDLIKTVYDPIGADLLRYLGIALCVVGVAFHEGFKRLGKRRRLRREKDQELRTQDKDGLSTPEGLDVVLLDSAQPRMSQNDDDLDDDQSRASLRSSASRVSRLSSAAYRHGLSTHERHDLFLQSKATDISQNYNDDDDDDQSRASLRSSASRASLRSSASRGSRVSLAASGISGKSNKSAKSHKSKGLSKSKTMTKSHKSTTSQESKSKKDHDPSLPIIYPSLLESTRPDDNDDGDDDDDLILNLLLSDEDDKQSQASLGSSASRESRVSPAASATSVRSNKSTKSHKSTTSSKSSRVSQNDDDDDQSRASLRSSASRGSRVSLAGSVVPVKSDKSTKSHKSTRSSKSSRASQNDDDDDDDQSRASLRSSASRGSRVSLAASAISGKSIKSNTKSHKSTRSSKSSRASQNDDDDDDDDQSRASLRSSASRGSRVSLAASAISGKSVKSNTKSHKSTRSAESATSTKSHKSTMSTTSNKSTTTSKSKPKDNDELLASVSPSLAGSYPSLEQIGSGHDLNAPILNSVDDDDDDYERSAIPMPMSYGIHSPTSAQRNDFEPK
jgi:hypothetical protein